MQGTHTTLKKAKELWFLISVLRVLFVLPAPWVERHAELECWWWSDKSAVVQIWSCQKNRDPAPVAV